MENYQKITTYAEIENLRRGDKLVLSAEGKPLKLRVLRLRHIINSSPELDRINVVCSVSGEKGELLVPQAVFELGLVSLETEQKAEEEQKPAKTNIFADLFVYGCGFIIMVAVIEIVSDIFKSIIGN